ncbi:sensor histidine kinase [Marinilactibacillus piezotolerans]|uniref:sensor histidine kinase n=1 Tax=Marinilactibacillus piezotolerans TaxID=258723 RepID=UPI0015C40E78|nr:sensor histidine kinase [Marinilactibacillus piezotolerans]
MLGFWTTFIFIALSWLFAAMTAGFSAVMIFSAAVFFTIYFILPIINTRMQQIGIIFLVTLTTISFYSDTLNLFAWLVLILLASQATDLFKRGQLYGMISLSFAATSFSAVFEADLLEIVFLFLFVVISLVALDRIEEKSFQIKKWKEQYISVSEELRSSKRQNVSNETLIRQEERNQIAREIHDSVGHRLTALLMQMEVARLKAQDDKSKQQFTELKTLAQSSLQDTRKAVQSLKTEEYSGLQAVILLIRKLESESHLRLSIKLQPGVLNLFFTNQQSVALYRSIQEALTNMMRHGNSRTAEIEFEIIAERDFRFKVSHPIQEKIQIKEGFGLTSMRERLNKIGGRLSFNQTTEQLSLIGQFPLEVKQND